MFWISCKTEHNALPFVDGKNKICLVLHICHQAMSLVSCGVNIFSADHVRYANGMLMKRMACRQTCYSSIDLKNGKLNWSNIYHASSEGFELSHLSSGKLLWFARYQCYYIWRYSHRSTQCNVLTVITTLLQTLKGPTKMDRFEC